MPYLAAPDETLTHQVGRVLLTYAIRPADIGDAETIRIPRAKLYDAIAPTMIGLRREDFNAAIKLLTKQSYAIEEATGTGKRADVVLERVTDDIGNWEFLLYDDFEDEIEVEPVKELLAAQGLDVTTPVPDDLIVRRRPRTPVTHPQDGERQCARCKKLLDVTKHFKRRSADPEHPDYLRWQSYCKRCTAEVVAAKRPYDHRVRTERYGGRTGRPRLGAQGPRDLR